MDRAMRLSYSKPRAPRDDKAGGWGAKGGSGSGKPQRASKPTGPKPDGCVEIFCGNLPWSIDEDKMAAFFKDCGTVTNTRWLNDKETGDFKGVAFVTFETTEQIDKVREIGPRSARDRPEIGPRLTHIAHRDVSPGGGEGRRVPRRPTNPDRLRGIEEEGRRRWRRVGRQVVVVVRRLSRPLRPNQMSQMRDANGWLLLMMDDPCRMSADRSTASGSIWSTLPRRGRGRADDISFTLHVHVMARA